MKIDTYRKLVDQIAADVLIMDEKRIVQFANQDSLDLLGFKTEEQLLGFNFDHLVSSDQLTYFQTFYQIILLAGRKGDLLYQRTIR